jgi:iron-sulfur cluster repair protein YtfE (RIC family)
MSDVVDLILAEHEKIRAWLSTLSQHGETIRIGAAASIAWRRLAGLLGVHAQAEQEIVYPALWGLAPELLPPVLHAAADHDDIEEIARETDLQPTGSPAWWQTVNALRLTTTRHMTWEEQVLLPALCRSVSLAARNELARQWTAYSCASASDAGDLALYKRCW